MSTWVNDFIKINRYSRPGTKLKGRVKGILHYTANPGAGAKNHVTYFGKTLIEQNEKLPEEKRRFASAHIFVDRYEARCIIPLDEVAYQANDGTYRGVSELKPNANLLAIGVEMCQEPDGSIHPDTIKRTEEVFVELSRMFNWNPLKDIVRHYDVTHKICPAPWVQNPKAFEDFKQRVNKKMSVNGWKQENGKWSFYKDGKKATGWIQDKEKWYYLDTSGIMKTGWQKVKSEWYYLDPKNGDMKTGWVQTQGEWYLLDDSGAMLTGWQRVKGKWYYLYPSGKMAHDMVIKLGSDGAMI